MRDPHVERYLPFLPPELRDPLVEPYTDWMDRPDGTTLHLFRHPAPENEPAATVVVLHGGGGHGRMLACVGVAAQDLGCSAVAPDLPGYGHTVVPDPPGVTYQDWIDAGAGVAQAEARSGRPVILLGASMGGRLALDIAHRLGETVAESVVTCLLDPRRPDVQRAASRHPALAAYGMPALGFAPSLTDRIRVPMRWLAPISAIANQPGLAATCSRDPLGAGGRVPLGFLRTWLQYEPSYEPEDFTACPVTLAHPGDDRWTPLELSQSWFDRLAVEKHLVVLDGCGHFPVEQPGLTQLQDALSAAVERTKT